MNSPLWDDGKWTPRAPLEGTQRADVCVVGLGGSGLAALDELAARGVSAIGVDAGPVGGGAAGRNGGFVLTGLARFYHDTRIQLGPRLAAALHQATVTEVVRQAEEFPELVHLGGSLRIAADAEELEDCRRHRAALEADGFPVAWYKGAEGEGLLLPGDGAMQPLARVRALATKVRAKAVRWYEHSPVRRVLPGQVVTAGGVVACDTVIVAVDGRLEAVLPEVAGLVRTARLQMLATAPAPEVRFPRPVYYRHGFEYWQQRPDGTVALGGFRDHALETEWTHATEPTDFVQGRLENFLRGHLRVRAPVTHRWAASVGYTPDGLPVLAEVHPKVWAVGGYNGTGNIVGALCARAAAQRACAAAAPWADLMDEATRVVRRGGTAAARAGG